MENLEKENASSYIVEVNNVTVRFNKANQKVDNLKEYFVRLVRRQLMFQEFIALKDVNLKIKKDKYFKIIALPISQKHLKSVGFCATIYAAFL